MALFGFGNSQNKIAKLKKKTLNKYGQAIERQSAMRQLYQIGSTEALLALLSRFTITLDVTITDGEEKRELYEWLVQMGADALPAIEAFVTHNEGVYWPIKALKEIAGLEKAVPLLLEALDRADSTGGRVQKQRIELVSNLRDFPHPLVLERLKTLASDENSDVRLMALDGLMTYGEDEALSIVAERLLDDEETPSIHGVLFEQLVEKGWSLKNWQEELSEKEIIPPHYRLDAGGRLVRAN